MEADPCQTEKENVSSVIQRAETVLTATTRIKKEGS